MEWLNKRFYSYNYFLREKFGGKVIKIPIDCGFTCPNRDGKVGFGGCIFCSTKGSGDFSGNRIDNITTQFDKTKKMLSKKWSADKYIIYFQAFTNTYANIETLKEKYYEAMSLKNVVGLAIATRPDCITPEIVNLLDEISKKIFVSVELGLQTSNDNTHKLINSCFTNENYIYSMNLLKEKNIDVVTHIILGLPYETNEDIKNSVNFAIKHKTSGIKLQLLYVLKNTKIEELYYDNKFKTLEKDEYINTVVNLIEIIPENVVIHRLTGDGNKNDLIAPKYSLNKRDILNSIDKELRLRNSYQGKYFYN